MFFMGDKVFLLMGEVWLMHNADTQCTVRGREEAKGQRRNYVQILVVLP